MILYRYIIRELIAPFLSSMSIIVFLFVMQQMVLLLDRVISKGLDPLIVLEVFLIQLAWIITLAIPMAILVATLTTFGRMAGDNEITSIKASGQNLWPLMTPVFAAAAVLGILNIYFNDLILPEANHRTANLLSDISRKKPTAFIEPEVLITDFSGYTIYTERVNNKTGGLSNIRIFSNTPGQDPSVTVADSADLRITPDQKYIELILYKGETHSISRTKPNEYFLGKFARQTVAIKNVDSRFERTNSNYRGDREKNVKMMLTDVADLKKSNTLLMNEYNALIDSLSARIRNLDSLCAADTASSGTVVSTGKSDTASYVAWVKSVDSTGVFTTASIRSIGEVIDRILRRMHANERLICQYMVEVHKKYSIPFACILFVLIGAPLGIMARRGGLTVGASYSLFFFIVYWASLIGGESMADKMIIPPWVAMWGGDIFIAACGIVLIILMLRETTIRFDALFSWWKGITGRKHPLLKAITGNILFRIPGYVALVPRWILRKLFGTLPIYLIGMFFGYVVGVLLAIIAIFIAVDYVSNLKRFEGVSLHDVALFYWYYLPWIIQITIPVVLLLASMFSIGKLAKNSELIAMKAAGINLRQLTLPLLALGVALSIGSFYGGEWILPRANSARRVLKDYMKDPQASTIERVHGIREFRRNFYYFGNPGTMYVFGEFSTVPQMARTVSRESFEGNRIVERISAASMLYDSTGWHFINGSIRSFTDSGVTLTTFDTLNDEVLTSQPVDMVARIKSKEEMSYWELRGFIDAARRRGEKVQKYMGELEFKVALPFMNFIVILLGIAITARAGRKGGAVLFGIGLALMFSFWIISRLAIVFAQNGHFSTLLGAWIGNILFLFIGLVLYRKAMR
ncbi:MAG: LptF/LptG family permease [Chitinispirillaceae bacterium]|nr:LptF/LptG family permease [Chitinispirillaceae bacterium]